MSTPELRWRPDGRGGYYGFEYGHNANPDAVPPAFVASITPDAIRAERAAKWIHFHPETFCHLCGRRNVRSWFADAEVWNAVADEHRNIDGAGIICPQCLTERYEAKFGEAVWRLSLDLLNPRAES